MLRLRPSTDTHRLPHRIKLVTPNLVKMLAKGPLSGVCEIKRKEESGSGIFRKKSLWMDFQFPCKMVPTKVSPVRNFADHTIRKQRR